MSFGTVSKKQLQDKKSAVEVEVTFERVEEEVVEAVQVWSSVVCY